MENITTKNGTNHILHGGYRFRKDKNLTRGYTSWRCITRKCCGRLRVGVTGDVVVSSSEHNHKPDADQSEVKNVVDEIQPRELENLRNEVESIVAEIQHCRMKARNGNIKKTQRSFNEQKIQIRIQKCLRLFRLRSSEKYKKKVFNLSSHVLVALSRGKITKECLS